MQVRYRAIVKSRGGGGAGGGGGETEGERERDGGRERSTYIISDLK